MGITERALSELRAAVRGEVLGPRDPGYDAARRVFNAMVDRRPALIVRCAAAADVQAAVGFARAAGRPLSVRGGGHNVSGKAVCEAGMMLDLSPMKGVVVDPRRRTARAEPGLTLGDLDRVCQAEGLATPTGIVSATGLAGLTLGGGLGWLNGVYGLACDNLVSVDVVTADGRRLTASDAEHPDLFWAVRGAGANLGVVTAFEFRLHEVGPVLGGGLAWPLDAAPRVLALYEAVARECPDALSLNAGFASAPDGTPVVGVNVAWVGPLVAGEKYLAPLRAVATPLADTISPMPYVALQSAGDAAFPPGRRHYWKAGFLRRLDPAAIDVLVHFAATRPSGWTQIGLQQMHGAAARVAPTATAFAHRQEQWDCLILSQWEHGADDERNIRWTRELYAALVPYLEPAVYVNDLGDDEPDRVRAAYGANYERIAAIKAAYDPDNVFRSNQNVVPASRVASDRPRPSG